MSHQLIFPKLSWSEFLLILDFLSIKDKIACGTTCKSACVHICIREKNLRNSIKSIASSFLPSGYRNERVLLVSYPRCGNSLLRQLLEEKTGVVTGSDSRSNRPLAASLIQCGFKGEGVIDSSVWVVKTHYPERMGYVKCIGERIILLVRNPFDAIESYFHMGLTNTHNKSLTVEVFEMLNDLWEECVENESRVWNDFYLYWLRIAEFADVPTLVLRYEDLINNSEVAMNKVLLFLNSGRPPLRTDIDYNRKQLSVSSEKSNKMGKVQTNGNVEIGYKPKTGGIGKGLKRMNTKCIDTIITNCEPCMKLFGYAIQITTKNNFESNNMDFTQHQDNNFNNNNNNNDNNMKLSSGVTTTTTLQLQNSCIEMYRPKHVQGVEINNDIDLSFKDNIKVDNVNINNENNCTTANCSLLEYINRYYDVSDSLNCTNTNNIDFKPREIETPHTQRAWINDPFSIRKNDDPFGRNFTYTRKDYTNNDLNPLPTDDA